MSDATMSPTDVPLLVISCDRYADLWPPFFELFWQRWADCPFPVYLGSNHRRFEHPRVRSILVGDDLSWASGVRRMVEQLGTTHVLIFLEDFLIKQPPDTAAIVRLIDVARARDVACLRLAPLPPPSRPPSQPIPDLLPRIGEVVPGTLYRVSAQPALWRVDALLRYLVPGFSAWEFELLGTQMSELREDVFWGPIEPMIVYDHGVEKGAWKPEGLRICEEAGVEVNLSARRVFTEAELDAHHGADVDNSLFSTAKLGVIEMFRRRERVAGLTRVARLLRAQPLSLQLWAIALFGALGPAPLDWLRRRQLRRRVSGALRRVPASSRARVAQFV